MTLQEIFENTKEYKIIQQYPHIFIFGTRDMWAINMVNCFFKTCGKEFEGFIVSDERMEGKPAAMYNKPVKPFSAISKELKESSLVITTQRDFELAQMILSEAGFQHVIRGACIRDSEPEILNAHYCDLLGHAKSVYEYCCEQSKPAGTVPDICLYAVTSHKNLHSSPETQRSKYIRYIQAGSACTDQKVCELQDNTGDNISIQNPDFAELSAGYWIWKNDHIHDYVGLYHYSKGMIWTDAQIEQIACTGVDAVLPYPLIIDWSVIKRSHLEFTAVYFDAIRCVAPEYLETAEKYLANHIFFAQNIVFAKKEVYDHYYEWLFTVLDKCAEINKQRNHVTLSRKWGVMAEFLSDIYWLHHIKQYSVLYAKRRSYFK